MSPILNLHNRIDLDHIPFTERGSRLLVMRSGHRISIRLGERWEKWQDEVGHYRKRPPIVEDLILHDAGGAPLDFTVESYPHVVTLHTRSGDFDWTFVDTETLLIRLPAGRITLEFKAFAQQAQPDRRGGTLRGRRNLAYTTNAHIVTNEVSSSSEPFIRVRLTVDAHAGSTLLLNVTPRIAFNRSLPPAEAAVAESRRRWEDWFAAAPPVLDRLRPQYDYAWWVMRVGLLTTRYFFTREACVPSKLHYVGVWHWDQFFHALAYRHIDARLAEDQIRIILDHQREDGMLPDAIHDEGTVTRLNYPVEENVTKPPLAAWTVLKLFERSGRTDFLEEVYEPLVRWHRWWLLSNANGIGLCEYRHPFSSGLDDSPLWDAGMPVVAPDLNTYLCLQCESLGQIAELLGMQSEAEQHRADADRFASAMIAHLWNEERGRFEALHDGQPVDVFTPFHLLPLWTGRLPTRIVDRLIAHLTDEHSFWTQWPLATVSISDPKFDPMQMWRGPTWVNINYLFIEALKRVGRLDLARTLRRKTLDLIMQHDDIYEYYNPITGERPPKAAPIFGWTSAVFIDLALQETEEYFEVEGE